MPVSYTHLIHTMRSGASADFGRLFRTTRYGSITAEKRGKDVYKRQAIGEGLQSFCIPGSVADQRKVGLGHGNLGKMLLEEETECFCFLAGHESFAAAEGAIGIAEKANKVRQKPLRVILNGLGKDAAQIISLSLIHI